MLSGSQFPVNVLPRLLLPLSLALPLTYGFDSVRAYLLTSVRNGVTTRARRGSAAIRTGSRT